MSQKTTTSYKHTTLGIMARTHIEHNPDLVHDFRKLRLNNKLDDFIESVAKQSNDVYLESIEKGLGEYEARDISRTHLLKFIREQIKEE